MSFKVGQQVVCVVRRRWWVRKTFLGVPYFWPSSFFPKFNEVCTIAFILPANEAALPGYGDLLGLEEYGNNAFLASGFLPIINDEQLEKMLEPQPETVTA